MNNTSSAHPLPADAHIILADPLPVSVPAPNMRIFIPARYNNRPHVQSSSDRPNRRQQHHYHHRNQQSRRPATRAAASTAGDENKITATGAGRSTKNAGLALKGKIATKGNTATAAATAANPKRRTALADSSNKVPQQSTLANGGKQSGKLGTVVEELKKQPSVTTAAANNNKRVSQAPKGNNNATTTKVEAEAEDEDGDAVMENLDPSSRPIKSLRSSTTSTRSAAVNTNNALANKSTNIPKRASTSAAAAGPSKNAGLKRSLRQTQSVAPAAEEPPKKVSKNAGLRLKREIQEVSGIDEADIQHHEKGLEGEEEDRVALYEDVEAPAGGRRRSKRLRPSDPTEDDSASATSAAAAKQEAEAADRSVAETIARVIESEVGSELDVDEDAKDAGWEDLDVGDEEDPLMVAEYVKEIHEYMKELEITTMADAHYMTRQSEVTWKMRSILVDWLVEVHGKFRLLPETIFLAVNVVDRLLSIRTVSLTKFQLVGIVSLFVAAKYEEVICPSVNSFLYMTDGGYTDEEMLSAERYILKQIDFNLSYPNPINFLRRISKADGYDIQTRTVAKYFLEMSCVERKLISAPPSLIAAAGMWLARKVLDRGEWNANLVHYSTYSQIELLPTAQLMLDYVLRRSQCPGDPIEHPHFYKKYSAKKFYRAAEIVREWAESRYLLRRGGEKAAGSVSLFPELDNAGRLEEWEDEGRRAPSVDFD